MLVVSICAWPDTAAIARVSTNAQGPGFEENMKVPKVRQPCFQLLDLAISRKCLADCARKMNLKIEPIAVFWGGRVFLSSLNPFCGKKICILSNGFLPPRFPACAEELIGGEGICMRKMKVCYYLL